ncbi:fructose-2,6-bisphosphatase [Sporosarcina sp. FA9]|uniref:fructose-2,6-bisphosphatase n=1 Tax=Sporosarcina sp. FA9 TaxID=3413030 RepID=UPI003F65B3C7
MKKSLFIYILIVLVLVGCGTTVGDSKKSTPNEEAKALSLTLFKPDADSNFVEPYEVEYSGNEEGLIRFIYEKVVTYEVGLIDFSFENDGKSLVLNLDDKIRTVQGSAGGFLFAGTIVESYFANYPNLEQVTLIHNGSYEEILDHLMVGEPYTRANAAFTAK